MQKTTLFNFYMIASQYCYDMAKDFIEKGEISLSKFYKNASDGFKIKARKLSLDEAKMVIWY